MYLKQKLNCVLMSTEEMVKPKEEAIAGGLAPFLAGVDRMI